jgi:hypothetical protein
MEGDYYGLNDNMPSPPFIRAFLQCWRQLLEFPALSEGLTILPPGSHHRMLTAAAPGFWPSKMVQKGGQTDKFRYFAYNTCPGDVVIPYGIYELTLAMPFSTQL